MQLVSATRLKEAPFWSDTLLGRSLRQPQHRELHLFNTAAWVGHLECLLERLLLTER